MCIEYGILQSLVKIDTVWKVEYDELKDKVLIYQERLIKYICIHVLTNRTMINSFSCMPNLQNNYRLKLCFQKLVNIQEASGASTVPSTVNIISAKAWNTLQKE